MAFGKQAEEEEEIQSFSIPDFLRLNDNFTGGPVN